MGWCTSFPTVDVRPESFALRSYQAEAMTARRLHHPPALAYECHARGAEFFKAFHFRFEIIRFDVQVYVAVVIHALQQDHGLVRFGGEFGVSAVAILIQRDDGLAECMTPERRRVCKVIGLAVEHD